MSLMSAAGYVRLRSLGRSGAAAVGISSLAKQLGHHHDAVQLWRADFMAHGGRNRLRVVCCLRGIARLAQFARAIGNVLLKIAPFACEPCIAPSLISLSMALNPSITGRTSLARASSGFVVVVARAPSRVAARSRATAS